MQKADRTIKCLLVIIAVLLAIVVARPLIQMTPSARAASSDSSNWTPEIAQSQSSLVIGYRTVPVTMIKLNSKEKLRAIHVIDSAQSFLMQYDDRVEVYRVDDVTYRELMAKREQLKNQSSSSTGLRLSQ